MLHEHAWRILKLLAESPTAIKQVDIETAVVLSHNTVNKRLKDLRELSYVYRPQGQRSGEAISDAGRAALRAHAK